MIEQTIREKLPEGFQRAEYLKDHGMVDMVVPRDQMRDTLARLCSLLTKRRVSPTRCGLNGSSLRMDQHDAILSRLLDLHPKKIDLSLGRTERLLDAIGRPDLRLPPTIHVAGTNGKGSTLAFLRAMLEASGAQVHVYTSPHLLRFNERIRLAAPGGGKLVDDEALTQALELCERANGAQPITFFEITTAAAFHLFSETPADWLLLETGLGGRYDATNVISAPKATIVTSVSLDHPEFLGETVEKIAFEKAGIFKRDTPAIVGFQSDAAKKVLVREARRVGAPLIIAGEDYHIFEENGRLVFEDERGLLDLPAPRLPGRHQHQNAAGPSPRCGRWFRKSLSPPWRRDCAGPSGQRGCNVSRRAMWLIWRPLAPRSGSTAVTMRTAGACYPRLWPSLRRKARVRWR